MFAEQKWNIIKSLSEGKFSPLQLSQRSKTTIANISQQLRLLEAAKLVKKEKVPNRDKGKPRSLFSLSSEFAYLVSAMNHFADRRLLRLENYHKPILRILFLDNEKLHYYLLKFYWKIEGYLDKIDLMLVFPHIEDIRVFIVSDIAKEIEKNLGSVVIKKPGGKSKLIRVQCFVRDLFVRLVKQGKKPIFSLNKLKVIYDPKGMFSMLEKEVIAKAQ